MPPKAITQTEILAQLEEMQTNPVVPKPDDVLLMDYQSEYLKSKLWRKIKRRVLKRDNNLCARCGGHATVVHHRSYQREVLEGNADHLLITVCGACHEVIHFDDSGNKRSFEECEKTLQIRPDPFDYPEPVIDLRKDPFKDWPPQRKRMTHTQLTNWRYRWSELRKQKKDALAEKKKNTKTRT